MRITADRLREADACKEQVAIFEQEWPDGVEPTPEAVARAIELGLDLSWLTLRGWVDHPILKAGIEKAGSACYAYRMAYNCGSDRAWAEKIIEKTGSAEYAYRMVRHCGSDPAWAEKVGQK